MIFLVFYGNDSEIVLWNVSMILYFIYLILGKLWIIIGLFSFFYCMSDIFKYICNKEE